VPPARQATAVESLIKWAVRAAAFLWRHRWSVPPSVLATLSFVNLASELSDDDVGELDKVVAQTVHGVRGDLDPAMLALTRLGEGRALLVITVLAVAVLIWRRRKREAVFLTAATLGTLVLNVLLKLAFRRARPEAVLYVISLPGSFSFPSGHALGATGVFLSLLVVARALGARGLPLLLLLATTGLLVAGIAVSRVYFGVHYPSDVIGGVLAGFGWISAITGYFYPRLLPGERTLATPPLT
jgi:undecaprenyl-diphosphatase